MKLFREAIIIFGIYLMGELISGLLNLPIPGNILGMLILLLLLCTKVIKLEQIETVSTFLLISCSIFLYPCWCRTYDFCWSYKRYLDKTNNSMYINHFNSNS